MRSTFLVLALAATTSAVFAADHAFKKERRSPADPSTPKVDEGQRRDHKQCEDASKPTKGDSKSLADVVCICCEADCSNQNPRAQDPNDVAFKKCYKTKCAPTRCYPLEGPPPQ